MSIAFSAALQTAIYQALVADVDLNAAVSGNIFDAPPTGTPPAIYVSLGLEDMRDASDKTGSGTRHDFIISVVSDAAGFLQAKNVASLIGAVLIDKDLTLATGTLSFLHFLRATAKRANAGQIHQIDLRFRARISA